MYFAVTPIQSLKNNVSIFLKKILLKNIKVFKKLSDINNVHKIVKEASL